MQKQFKRLALTALCLLGLLASSGCVMITPNETWYCYDEQGQPLESVIIVCNYGLANSAKRGVGYGISDALGKVTFVADKDMPRGLERGYECIYSKKLQSGYVDIGERWHKGAPIPKEPVYFDEHAKKIFIKSGIGDPVCWHAAINRLINEYRNVGSGKMAMYGPGAGKLWNLLSTLVPVERDAFLKAYGEQPIPTDYLKSNVLNAYFPRAHRQINDGLKFKDITLPLP
ncbi:MAG: hypothetical protein NTU80_04110 [Verrucomicrobia bacterium]|nr:hypothetical protein [Verrucomicrobiota bacterium]